MPFRHDINTLRALSVLLVTLYHFGIPGAGSGLIGVDLFFVISGYLMTQILLSPKSPGYGAFLLARSRRILPALIALCLILLVLGWFTLYPPAYAKLAKHAGTSLLFISNFVYNNEAGYFDLSASRKWLLHTWSLSVEWQFYLLYPALLKLLHRPGRPWLLPAGLGLLGAASAAGMLIWDPYKPNAEFYLLPWRAWEMLAGALAYFCHQRWQLAGRPWHGAQYLLLAGCVAAGAWLPHANWPNGFTLLPVTLAAAFIAIGQPALAAPRWLGRIGDWSYSIYLWHWPVWVWLNQQSDSLPLTVRLGGIAASILLGAASFHLVETPFRKQLRLKRPMWLAMAAGIATCLLVIRLDGMYWLRYPAQWHTVARHWFAFESDYQKVLKPYYQADSCFLGNDWLRHPRPAFCTQESASILLAGDSHAAHLWWGLSRRLPAGSLDHLAAPGCEPISYPAQDRKCLTAGQALRERLSQHRYQTVILAGYWYHTLQQISWPQLDAELARWKRDFPHTTFLLVGSVPIHAPSLPDNLAREVLQTGSASARSPQGIRRESYTHNQQLAQLAARHGMHFFDPVAALCNAQGCLRLTQRPQPAVQWDYGHLTAEGSELIAAGLVPALQAISRQPIGINDSDR